MASMLRKIEKERYTQCKQLGICCKCTNRPVELGRSRCKKCADARREQRRCMAVERRTRLSLTKHCLHCGQQFVPRQYKSRFCDNCRKQDFYIPRPLHDISCIVCGTDFKARYQFQKVCSAVCREIHKATKRKVKDKQRKHRPKKYKPMPQRSIACLHCGKQFSTNISIQKYCSYACLARRREKNKYEKTPLTKRKTINRLRHLTRTMWRFDHSAEHYYEMLKNQHGICGLCGEPPKPGEYLVVDHDHDSNMLRELIHDACNKVIGFSKDDPNLCQKAARYLLRHHSK